MLSMSIIQTLDKIYSRNLSDIQHFSGKFVESKWSFLLTQMENDSFAIIKWCMNRKVQAPFNFNYLSDIEYLIISWHIHNKLVLTLINPFTICRRCPISKHINISWLNSYHLLVFHPFYNLDLRGLIETAP